ncbi:MAG: protein translocase subunit SecD [Betaproteobacteria bacterium]|nr:protein translocase subunit SecD [Betaproteobacteria bacterium]MDE2209375.1 protein translocase subunit SecD [Betaproteobacteria bacterium]
MNRYPLWKYIVIAVALVVGMLYTLPNFFPEVPAVQISSSKSAVKIDNALLGTIEDTLKSANIAYRGAELDSVGIKVRFNDYDTQLRAKDLLQSKLGDNYIVALNLLSSSPHWLASIGALPMYLGLDLRGGVHFLLQVDMKAALDKAADRYTTDIRSLMREKKIIYSGVGREGSNVVLRFKDSTERSKARFEIEKAFPDLQVREQDAAGGDLRLVAGLSPPAQTRIQESAVQQNITILRNRVNELGVAEPIIQQAGTDRVVVQLPGVQDTARAKDILGRTATLEIRMVNEDPGALEAAIGGSVPFGSDLLTDRNGQPILVQKQVVLTGDRISDAQSGFDPQSGEPAVHVDLDPTGARIFKEVTRDNVGKRMAILLIEKGKSEVITAPVIREEIGGGRVQISGRMSSREANDIALLMRAGALAAPMEIIEERTVGPSLGKENITKGFDSVKYGFVVLAVFICAYYMLMGVISTIALVINLMLLIAILSMLQATLTLPGMAAIALTLGMAIDANVLINERIREELRWGSTPHAAIQAGYERAWGTILDSNVTTMIAGIALFAFGTGPVKGFAVVHVLGILTSMFSAVFISRGIVALIYGGRRKLERISIGQVWQPASKATVPAKS